MYCKPPEYYLSQPVKFITEEWFHEMLEVLPPGYWYRSPDTESFQMIEMQTGNVTEAFLRIGDTYCSMYVIYGTKHADIWERALTEMLK